MIPRGSPETGAAARHTVSTAPFAALYPAPDLWATVGDVLQRIAAVWSFQLTAIDGRPLTVGKLVITLLVLLVGVPIARLVVRRISRRLFERIGLEPGAAAAFETLSFYAVVAALVLVALWVSEIPLTVFTLAGGALAIGIGFGSQKIVNNFISGLILLFERPIKVGDLIEVGETFGRVESIGARSTKIKTFDNFHIIVPNGTILDQNVVNWTHSDNMVRVRMKVGVAYGSPTRRVEELLLQAIQELEKVVSPPEPVVLFEDFGDSALLFEALFWIVMRRPMDRRRILSDLRYRVDELFREDGIVIAFPQRDVHLDNLQPLQVRLLEKDEA
jgi:potassium-dependent mechanosensitive channel